MAAHCVAFNMQRCKVPLCGSQLLVSRRLGGLSALELRPQLGHRSPFGALQHLDRLPRGGELLDKFLVSGALFVVLPSGVGELVAQLLRLVLGGCELFGGLLARCARLRPDLVEPLASLSQLLIEPLVLGVCLVDLLP
jgi:hypothetical protein